MNAKKRLTKTLCWTAFASTQVKVRRITIRTLMQFDNYRHFKNYCLKIARNNNLQLASDDVEIFVKFENLYNELIEIETEGFILIPNDFLEKISSLFKKNPFSDCISQMNYFIKKFNRVKSGEIEFYYLITSFSSMFGVHIEFRQKSLIHNNYNGRFTQLRYPLVEILDKEEVIYIISNLDFSYKNRHGVYFIYDANETLSYIGKSSSCILTRSLSSSRERDLLDFSKIELHETKTKSDVAIYEAYYISKHKPPCNRDIVYDDEPSMSLPDLPVSKVIARDKQKDFRKINYKCFKKTIIDLDQDYNEKREQLIVYNQENINALTSQGYSTEYEARNKVYLEEIAEIRKSGAIATAEVFDLIEHSNA